MEKVLLTDYNAMKLDEFSTWWDIEKNRELLVRGIELIRAGANATEVFAETDYRAYMFFNDTNNRCVLAFKDLWETLKNLFFNIVKAIREAFAKLAGTSFVFNPPQSEYKKPKTMRKPHNVGSLLMINFDYRSAYISPRNYQYRRTR